MPVKLLRQKAELIVEARVERVRQVGKVRQRAFRCGEVLYEASLEILGPILEGTPPAGEGPLRVRFLNFAQEAQAAADLNCPPGAAQDDGPLHPGDAGTFFLKKDEIGQWRLAWWNGFIPRRGLLRPEGGAARVQKGGAAFPCSGARPRRCKYPPAACVDGRWLCGEDSPCQPALACLPPEVLVCESVDGRDRGGGYHVSCVRLP